MSKILICILLSLGPVQRLILFCFADAKDFDLNFVRDVKLALDFGL